MKILLLLSALLASLTGLGLAARTQAVGVEQVVAVARAATTHAVAHRPANTAGFRAPVALELVVAPMPLARFGERRLL